MPATALRVELLTSTENPLPLIYATFRQCYTEEAAADLWPKLLSGEVSREAQAEFIGRIMESRHESPIEHVSFSFAVSGVSRALTHQLVRHRIASYSQQSQRYVDANGFLYVVPPAVAGIPEARDRFIRAMEDANYAYDDIQAILTEHGRKKTANEDARYVLPNACETKIVVTMNCRALLHFFELRCCNRAQWEIRAMANQMLALCRQALPVVFDGAGARCERLGYCPEIEKFRCGKMPGREVA